MLLLLLLLPVLCWFLAGIHETADKVDGHFVKAWAVFGPGYVTTYYPEHRVDLRDWVGSKVSGLSAQVNGHGNPEVDAGFALRATMFRDHDFVQRDGHWELFKPASESQFWSWTGAIYRLTPWRPWAEMEKR